MRPDFLTNIIPRERIFFEEPMAHHTSLRVGGPAEVLVMPRTEAELVRAVAELRRKGVPFHVIGRGSNLLVSDSGVRGVIVVVANGTVDPHEDDMLRVGAGVPLSTLYEEAAYRGFTGLEFLSGIPGTLGGAITMNAGAYGHEIGEYVAGVRLLDQRGNITAVPALWMQFGYRTSVVQKRELIVLSADLQLPRGDVEQSRREAARLRQLRKDKQPLDYPSAGSTFRRPADNFAGALIEQCGLKGARIGGAMVSPKHAGFIINADHASASDIYRLIGRVRDVVREQTGIVLEPEVKLLGDFG